MPLPSSTMVEVGVRMLCVQRGLGLLVVLLESHSAMRGVIFQRTVVCHIVLLVSLMLSWHHCDHGGDVIGFMGMGSPAPVVPPALEDDNRVGDWWMV